MTVHNSVVVVKVAARRIALTGLVLCDRDHHGAARVA
jgi:hypothetical protein